MASRKKPVKKPAKKAARRAGLRRSAFPWTKGGMVCGANGYGKTPPYDPNLKVHCLLLDKWDLQALLAEFADPNQKFRALLVKGSPFVSLSISPTRAATD